MDYSKFIRSVIAMVSTGVLLLASGCGGGGRGGSSGGPGVSFPTPELPAAAVVLDGANAADFADSALIFLKTLSTVTSFKTAAMPPIPVVIKKISDRVTRRHRSSLPVAAGVTEDLSPGLCVTGSAIANFDETSTSQTGVVTFTNCDLGGGLTLNGNLSVDSSWNNTTLDYNQTVGGTLVFNLGADILTVVLNANETGNDGTGDFSNIIAYSMDGIPGGGFLVTTTQPIVGNASTLVVTAGQLIVTGANNTRLRITVTGPNMADIYLDSGSGFVFLSSTTF